jgi:hypothetical protein
MSMQVSGLRAVDVHAGLRASRPGYLGGRGADLGLRSGLALDPILSRRMRALEEVVSWVATWCRRALRAWFLRAIAHAQVPLTHEGIGWLSPWRSVIYVRDLLVASGILPQVDRFLFLFEQWLPVWLEEVPDPEHRKISQRYATWHTLRRLRAVAKTEPIGHYRHQLARKQLRVAASFPRRPYPARDRPLGVHPSPTLTLVRARHAIAHDGAASVPALGDQGQKHVQADTPSDTASAAPTPIGPLQRLELIRRIQAGDGMDLTEGVIALLVLLYAQPLPKITRLTVDDITVDDGQMLIRLSDPPAPVPPPFDQIISQYLAARPNLTTCDQSGQPMAVPGRRAGQPLHPTTMRLRFNNLGIPDLSGRSRVLREMLLHAPPSVVASMLGYTPNRAGAIAAEAGATWKHYAPGDHTRTRRPNKRR